MRPQKLKIGSPQKEGQHWFTHFVINLLQAISYMTDLRNLEGRKKIAYSVDL